MLRVSLLVYLFLLSFVYVYAEFISKFESELKADELIYTSISIPKNAIQVEIALWCRESSIKPIAYLKYNGIPTLSDYDGKVELISLPKSIVIYDIQPTQSVLYIGIHGGDLLHSYYYFAGSPITVLIGLETKITECGNDLQIGSNCDIYPQNLPMTTTETTTNSQLTINTPAYYSFNTPSNIDGFKLDFTIPSLPSSLCDAVYQKRNLQQTTDMLSRGDNSSNILQFLIDIYLDQPEEDENAGRESVIFSYDELCGEGSRRQMNDARVDVSPVIVSGTTVTSATVTTAFKGNNHKSTDTKRALDSSEIPVTQLTLSMHSKYPLGGKWYAKVQLIDLTSDSEVTNSTRHLEEGSTLQALDINWRTDQQKKHFSAYETQSSDIKPAFMSSQNLFTRQQTQTTGLSNIQVPLTIQSVLYMCPSGYTGYDEYTVVESTDTVESRVLNNEKQVLDTKSQVLNKEKGVLDRKSRVLKSFSPYSQDKYSQATEYISDASDSTFRRKKDDTINCIHTVNPIHYLHTPSVSYGYFTFTSDLVSVSGMTLNDTHSRRLTAAEVSKSSELSNSNSRLSQSPLLQESKRNLNEISTPTQQTTEADSYVIFATQAMSQLNRIPSIGGTMEIQLRIQVPYINDDWNQDDMSGKLNRSTLINFDITSTNFYLSLRIGGVPFALDDDSMTSETRDKRNLKSETSGIRVISTETTPMQSFNAYIFSSQDAHIITNTQANDNTDDINDDNAYIAPTNIRRSTAYVATQSKPIDNGMHMNYNQHLARRGQSAEVLSTDTNTVTPYISTTTSTGRKLTTSGLRIHKSPLLQQTNDEFLFTWTVDKPVLPHLFSTTENGNQLYIRVSSEPSLSTRTDNGEILQNNVNFEDLLVSVKVLFVPCSVDYCGKHGYCYTKSGDVDAATCTCLFPYGGEQCDTLIMPYWFYVVQVFTMVITNLAMLPGIGFSYKMGLTIVCAALSFAMIASMLYHLCDTDTFCVAGFSFHSLQVLDILFCTLCICTGILFYAPISNKTHATLVMISAGVLITPVVNDATNPYNIAFAIIGSTLLCSLYWLLHFCGLHNFNLERVYAYCTGNNIPHNNSDKNKHARRRKYMPILSTDDVELQDHTTHGGIAFNDLGFAFPHNIDDHSESHHSGVSSSSGCVSNYHETDDDGELQGDLEMHNIRDNNTTTSNPLQHNTIDRGTLDHTVTSTRRTNNSNDSSRNFHFIDTQHNTPSFRNTYQYWYDLCLDIPHYLYDLRYSIIGIFLAVTGLLSFVNQTRENYWLIHSLWHVLVMLSSYFLIKGRYDFMRMIEYPYVTEDCK